MSQAILELKNVNIYQGKSLILSEVNIAVDKVNLFTWWEKQVRVKAAC